MLLWLASTPVIALLVFALCYLLAAIVFFAVQTISRRNRGLLVSGDALSRLVLLCSLPRAVAMPCSRFSPIPSCSASRTTTAMA